MSNLIDDILSNIDIVDIIWTRIKLKRVWRNFVALCPFHKEKTPSFVVSPDKQIFKCFWCGIGWNAIKFIMEYEKVDFRDAIKILAKEAKIDINKYKTGKLSSDEKKWLEKEKLININKHALAFFKKQLQNNSTALNYLAKERQLNPKIINLFNLWYAPNSFSALPDYLTNFWFSLEDILKTWLVKKDSQWNLYSFFKNRIIFPIYDHIWNLVAFAWRIINPKDNPKYLNIPETPIYDKSKILYWLNIAKNYINEWKKIFVVEGYMDVIGLARWNTPIWVASCWTALTPNHLKLLKRYTENIIFAFDNDEAGFQATLRATKIAYENEIYPKIFLLPEKFKDFDEAINELGEQNFQNLILNNDNYQDSFSFILQKLKNKYSLSDPIERKKFINEIFDLLSYLKDYNILQIYIEYLAKILKLDSFNLFKQFKTFLRKNKNYIKEKEENYKSTTPEIDYLIWSLIFENFIETLPIKNKEKIIDILTLISSIASYIENSLLNRILEEKLSDEDVNKLKEASLRREQQKENIDTFLYNLLRSYLQKLLKITNKATTIPPEEKINFLKEINKILKT